MKRANFKFLKSSMADKNFLVEVEFSNNRQVTEVAIAIWCLHEKITPFFRLLVSDFEGRFLVGALHSASAMTLLDFDVLVSQGELRCKLISNDSTAKRGGCSPDCCWETVTGAQIFAHVTTCSIHC